MPRRSVSSFAHPVDHLRGRFSVARAERLEADEHPALVHGGAETRSSDGRADVIDGGVLRMMSSAWLCNLTIASNETSAAASVLAMMSPVSSSGKALGRDGVEMHREHDHAEEGKQRDGLVAQRHP